MARVPLAREYPKPAFSPVLGCTGTSSPVPFFHLLQRLKTTKREGWRRFGIIHGESISDHMYRMSMIAMMAPPSLPIDVAKCMQMCLIHDMAEALVGDLTPVDGVTKTEKSRREGATMDVICNEVLQGVHNGFQAAYIRRIWQEYEDDVTLEAHFVHDVDKMELVLQMFEYEHSNEGQIDLGEFTRVAARIRLKEVKGWAEEVMQERKTFWKSKGLQPSTFQDDFDVLYGDDETTQSEASRK